MQLFPDIHLVEGVTCNVYIITEPDGLTVIDSGMPNAAPRILAAIRALGRDPRDVRHIALTHQHFDHIGALAALVAASGAETWASAGDAPAIEGRARREAPKGPLGLVFRVALLPRVRPVAITHTLGEGDTLPTLGAEGGLRVVETPGHTAGHISFYLPARRMLFAGDALQTPGGRVVPPPDIFTTDPAQARRSLAHLATLDVDAILAGHGAPITTGAGAPLAQAAGAMSKQATRA